MSFCDEIDSKRRCSSTGFCGNICASGKSGCEACISSCNCQSNVGCLDRDACGGLRPAGTAATGACPGPCQCVDEEIWNSNMPPKPNCRWLNNFAELRRQWSDHGRRQTYESRVCSRPCRTVASCRPCLPPTPPCSGTILFTSDCQKCCGSRRLTGGASKSEIAPADKSSSPEPLKREAGGGCPPPSCSYSSTRYNSNAGCSSTVSSSCPSQRRPPTPSYRASDCGQPCALKSILKKHSCCQYSTSPCCLCQPMLRGCNCPPPIQVNARAAHECSCECPSSPECACPPSERRFLKATIKCPNARLCCPSPRLPPGPKCHCLRSQPCQPPPCNPCTFSKCRGSVPAKNPCRPGSSCPSYQPCRPISTTSPSCRPPTPCRKLTFCTAERNARLSSPCTGQSWRGIFGDKISESSICNEQNDDEEREICDEKDCGSCYATACAESQNGSEYSNQSRDLTLDEESVQNSTSKAFISLSGTANPSTSVDPNSCGTQEERDETAFENAAEVFEVCTTKKSSKDSWYTSPIHAPSESGGKPDCYAFHKEYSLTRGNMYGNPVLAKLLSRIKSFRRVKDLSAPSKTLPRHSVTFRDTPQEHVGSLAGASISIPTTTPTRGIDRRRRNGDRLREDTTDASSLPRKIATNVTRGVVHPVGASGGITEETSRAHAQANEKKSANARCDVFSNLGGIGYSTLVPSPLALISFALLILVAVTWSSGSAFYRRYLLRKRICWKYLSL